MPNLNPRSHRAGSLRKLRKDAGLDQAELAAKAGCQQSTISQLETGKRRGTVGLLQDLAIVLDCTLDDLLREPA